MSTVFFMFLVVLIASETNFSPKVICASRAEHAPVIDGSLDEDCWSKTEEMDNFVNPMGKPYLMPMRTTIRVLYDSENIYLGLECQYNDIEALEKLVKDIRRRKDFSEKFQDIRKRRFVNKFSAEIFFDPGASRVNYYKVIINAAGQICGHFKRTIYAFEQELVFKGKISGKRWTAELAFPYKDLMPGNRWGFNICRNDETYYSIWKQVGNVYDTPSKFGTILIGNYKSWWNAVWNQGAIVTIEELEKTTGDGGQLSPLLENMFQKVKKQADDLQQYAETHPPKNRKNFEKIFLQYENFRKDFSRLNCYFKSHKISQATK